MSTVADALGLDDERARTLHQKQQLSELEVLAICEKATYCGNARKLKTYRGRMS